MLEVEPNLSYEEKPICVLDMEIKMLRNKEFPLVKVLWWNHKVEEATWEMESTKRDQNLYLFIGWGCNTPYPYLSPEYGTRHYWT
ncbi:Chromo domain-containing protein [Gossypium australe]|uniref:Chromo domain-containing protein n=1 Tax=Gossypium australe TaxID=47621 RepID=A0A5B6W8K7_9ROSI|nr:Chromo domain-containing protein [Gossypium australe]